MSIYTLRQITDNREIFESMAKKLISYCAFDVLKRDNFTDIDTVLLKDIRDLSYQESYSQIIWNIYKTIANRFIVVFEGLKTNEIPFHTDSHLMFNFLKKLWEEYFSIEISSIISNEKEFSVYLMKVLTKQAEGLIWMNQINEVLNKRYS